MAILKVPKGVTIEVAAEEDDSPVRGNALASGDEGEDKKCEDDILARLGNGDVWAWASVHVTARFGEFSGAAYLGECSYSSEESFRADAYFAGMVAEALEDLKRNLEAAHAEGDAARLALGMLGWK